MFSAAIMDFGVCWFTPTFQVENLSSGDVPEKKIQLWSQNCWFFSRTDNNSVSYRITRQSTQLSISKTLIIVPNNSIKLDSWRWNHILKLPWVILNYIKKTCWVAMLFIFSVMKSNKLKLPAPKNCNEQYRNNYFRTTLTPPSPLTVLEKYSDCLGLWGV